MSFIGKKHTIATKKLMSIHNGARTRPPVRYWLGKHLSEESAEKIRKARTGTKASNETRLKMSSKRKGKNNPMWGKKRPEMSGNKNPHWKGGVYPKNMALRHSLEYKIWRRAVFERDCYTCQICGEKSNGNIEADHIKPFSLYPELRFAIDNGRTLCEGCHKIYGWKYRPGRRENACS